MPMSVPMYARAPPHVHGTRIARAQVGRTDHFRTLCGLEGFRRAADASRASFANQSLKAVDGMLLAADLSINRQLTDLNLMCNTEPRTMLRSQCTQCTLHH